MHRMLSVNSSLVVQSTNACNISSISSMDGCPSSTDSPSKLLYIAFCSAAIPLVVIAVTSNGFAFIIFYKKPVFRKIISNRLIMNLMAFNIISCILLFPAILMDLHPRTPGILHHSKRFQIAFCTWGSFISSFTAHGSVFAMLTISLDQYVAILDPLEYPNQFPSLISSQLIVCVWCVSLLASLSSSLVFISGRGTWKTCDAVQVSFISKSQRLGLSLGSLFLYILPISCLVFAYAQIFFEARNNSIRRRRRSSSIINVTENPLETHGDLQIKESNTLLSPASPESECSLRLSKCQHPKLVHLRNNNKEEDSFSLTTTSSGGPSSSPRRNGGIIKQQSVGSNSFPRKCSFGSVNEVHLVEGNNKVRTIVFSLNEPLVSPERISNNSEENSVFLEEAPQNDERGVVRSPPPSIVPPLEDGGGKDEDERSLKGSPGIFVRTSQAARRLSCSFSKGANNVYHFLRYNEERRTAKISSLVIFLAVLSWSPTFILLFLSNFKSSSTSLGFLRTLHLVSALSGLCFASLSPFLYVYRSEKVRASARKIFLLAFTCRSSSECEARGSTLEPQMGSEGSFQNKQRRRSHSCPLLSVEK